MSNVLEQVILLPVSLGCLWVVSMIEKKGVDAESLGAVEKSDFSTCSTCLLELY